MHENFEKWGSARTLDESGIAAHELFMSYVRAGFTRAEALHLTETLIKEYIKLTEVAMREQIRGWLETLRTKRDDDGTGKHSSQ